MYTRGTSRAIVVTCSNVQLKQPLAVWGHESYTYIHTSSRQHTHMCVALCIYQWAYICSRSHRENQARSSIWARWSPAALGAEIQRVIVDTEGKDVCEDFRKPVWGIEAHTLLLSRGYLSTRVKRNKNNIKSKCYSSNRSSLLLSSAKIKKNLPYFNHSSTLLSFPLFCFVSGLF